MKSVCVEAMGHREKGPANSFPSKNELMLVADAPARGEAIKPVGGSWPCALRNRSFIPLRKKKGKKHSHCRNKKPNTKKLKQPLARLVLVLVQMEL